MYRRDSIFRVVSQPSKSPHQQEHIEQLSAGYKIPRSPHSCHPGQYHRPSYSKKCYIFVMITLINDYYRESYGKVKSAEEEDPSADTLSVVVRDPAPPNSKTSPEGSDQQRCQYLSCTRVTVSGVKVPSASNFTQDLRLGHWLMVIISFTFFSMKNIYLVWG